MSKKAGWISLSQHFQGDYPSIDSPELYFLSMSFNDAGNFLDISVLLSRNYIG